ncbi:hypothetical protein CRM22_002658 [Opisthorchis felineus]|uniref:G-protein coupled receptors family 1 profile domain-containing protein n=1 Tax=Opisthorchis felineus TaxID=147828 RepID=A0A4S2M534_OPIFE|nr:hypothetical protein CRM22_002658 [Opisthorchis felineus]
MSGYLELQRNYSFYDTPYDMLVQCEEVRQGLPDASMATCVSSTILGIYSGYLLPFVCTFGFLANVWTAVLFLLGFRRPTRQLVYLAFLAIANAAIHVLWGWLWLFPAKGLPFMTGARLYYFTFSQSQEACRLHRFAYSFGSTLSANLLLLAASDRFMCTYWPTKMLRFQRRHAYYAVIAVTVFSGVMMLPLGICVEWVTIGGKVWCWIDNDYSGVDVYHALFSNACVIQPLCTGVLNICFLVKIRKLLHKRAQLASSIGSKGRRELAASETLVVITLVTLCTALPQSAAYNAAFVLSRRPNTQEQTSLAFNISDIMWCVMLTQTACNIVVYLVRMSAFRKMSLSVIKCQGFRRRAIEGTNDQDKTLQVNMTTQRSNPENTTTAGAATFRIGSD